MAVMRQVLGRRVETGGQEHRGWLPPGAAKPLPTPTERVTLDVWIESQDGGGFILAWRARDADMAGDTWHATVADAEDAAREFFGIARQEWRPGAGA